MMIRSRRALFMVAVLVAAIGFVGCGGGSGIEEGMPSNKSTTPDSQVPDAMKTGKEREKAAMPK